MNDLIERMRLLERDHEPDGWPAVQMRDITALLDALEACRKCGGEPVAWRVHPFDYGIGHEGVYALTSRPDQVAAWERKGWEVQPLFTAPQPAEPVALEPSDAISVVGMPEFDALMDHIYENGTASEGVLPLANAFARALLARGAVRLNAQDEPAAPQPAQQPVSGADELLAFTDHATLPAQQERKPLTESAIQQIGLAMPSLLHPGGLIEFARAIERAHGITED
jgi:hypothetical protein